MGCARVLHHAPATFMHSEPVCNPGGVSRKIATTSWPSAAAPRFCYVSKTIKGCSGKGASMALEWPRTRAFEDFFGPGESYFRTNRGDLAPFGIAPYPHGKFATGQTPAPLLLPQKIAKIANLVGRLPRRESWRSWQRCQ